MKSGLVLGVNPLTIRQSNDFYATHPSALELFLKQLDNDKILLNKTIWECACGQGHLSKVLENRGYKVLSTDLIDRGYGKGEINFLNTDINLDADILTNPPFKLAEDFVNVGMNKLIKNNKLLLFLKIQFLEGQKRKNLFKKYPPKYIYCYSSRQLCSRNAMFDKYCATTLFYAWYIWEKEFIGETILRWI